MFGWRNLPLVERIHRLQYVVPPLLVLLVIGYQLGVARFLEEAYGHAVHYGVEIGFYSLAGPMVTWLTLVWVERRLVEKEVLERQVRRREQHLASLSEASADAILSLDRAGRISTWNRGAEHLFGYRAETIIGRTLDQLLLDTPRLLARLQRDGVVQNFETTAVAQDGRVIAVDLTQTLLTEDTAHSLTSSLILRDITARRERDAVVEEERARIARDLHDGVAQVLYLLALKADMAVGQVDQAPDQVMAALQEIGQRSRQVIREIRRTIFALRPLEWSEEGFLPALRRFVKDFSDQLNWQASFDLADENLSIPDRLQPTVFRLVQESLNNVAKHTEAEAIQVGLSQIGEPPRLKLTICDNGPGFDPFSVSGSGLGLRQMRQRVEAVRGTFSLKNRTGGGTMIKAEIPL